ncbi:transposase [Salinisphaera sp. RV14]|uniref:transposase n=1 Tax=Salinisphaera sp. RV14 TaxID=3454140 RepID=UPI003F863CB0
MPRLPRFNLSGVPQHVIQRGNNRQACFFDEDDYLFYLECLQTAAGVSGCDVHAYVLMTNHVHLLVTPHRDRAVSRMMQSVGRRYVGQVNRRHERTGTLWEGRYRASPVESERYLLACYRYIELNPVRAQGMADMPDDYRWSSYHANALGRGDAWLTPHSLYNALGPTAAARQHAYRELFRIPLTAETEHEIRLSARQGVVLGSEAFRERIGQSLNIRATPGRRGRPKKNNAFTDR